MKRKGIIILLIAIALAFSIPAFAQQGQRIGKMGKGGPGGQMHGKGFGKGGAFWKNPMVAEKLQLTDAQIQKLEEIEYSHREKQIDLRTQTSKAELAFEKTMSAKPFNEAAVRKAAQKLGPLQSKRFMIQVEHQLSIRKVLTDEQIAMMDQLRPGMMNRIGKMKGNKGKGYKGKRNR